MRVGVRCVQGTQRGKGQRGRARPTPERHRAAGQRNTDRAHALTFMPVIKHLPDSLRNHDIRCTCYAVEAILRTADMLDELPSECPEHAYIDRVVEHLNDRRLRERRLYTGITGREDYEERTSISGSGTTRSTTSGDHRAHLRPHQERHALNRPDQSMGTRFRTSLAQNDLALDGLDKFGRCPAAGPAAVRHQGRSHRLLRAKRAPLPGVRACAAKARGPSLRGQLRLHRSSAVDALGLSASPARCVRWPASGAAAPLLRRAWELGKDDSLKRELTGYNMDDCRAARTIADALERICGNDASDLGAVHVSSLEVSFLRTFGRFDSALPEFTKINNAAYWDYQRSKVYARTDKAVRRSVRKPQRRSKGATVDKEVTVEEVPETCPQCLATRIGPWRRGSQIVHDLSFTRRGIKRSGVRYRYKVYRCRECRAETNVYSRGSRYGRNLRAFVVYLLLELHLSNRKAVDHLSLLFGLSLDKHEAYRIKSAMAEEYMPTYRGILRQIAVGSLVHADETRGVVKGGGHYLWVFANLTTVAYVYSESREAAILEEVLDGFKGVLVSDFYAAYDSVPCAQQKCLVHLMRDINDSLHKNPFDDELKEIAGRFGALLREIVETIDTYGLKARHLGKHRKPATRFIEHVAAMRCGTEAGLALKKRIERNKDKLFTFLGYDGVPWNNNNAEHALRAFTRLRNVMTTSTPKGHREYAVLLSIQQTLRYRGMGFLEFMRSGRMEIDG
jgi:hypothetical protein